MAGIYSHNVRRTWLRVNLQRVFEVKCESSDGRKRSRLAQPKVLCVIAVAALKGQQPSTSSVCVRVSAFVCVHVCVCLFLLGVHYSV